MHVYTKNSCLHKKVILCPFYLTAFKAGYVFSFYLQMYISAYSCTSAYICWYIADFCLCHIIALLPNSGLIFYNISLKLERYFHSIYRFTLVLNLTHECTSVYIRQYIVDFCPCHILALLSPDFFQYKFKYNITIVALFVQYITDFILFFPYLHNYLQQSSEVLTAFSVTQRCVLV